jgi:hypothetical protein
VRGHQIADLGHVVLQELEGSIHWRQPPGRRLGSAGAVSILGYLEYPVNGRSDCLLVRAPESLGPDARYADSDTLPESANVHGAGGVM